MKRLRMTVLYEFDWTGETLTDATVDTMVGLFLKDPTEFLGIDRMAFDETIYVDVEDITNG